MRKYDDLYKEGAPPSQSFTRQCSLQKSPKEYINHKLREDICGRDEIFSKQNFNSTPTWVHVFILNKQLFIHTQVIVTSQVFSPR